LCFTSNFTCNKPCFTSIQKYRFHTGIKTLILVLFRISIDRHTILSLENDLLAFCYLTLTSVLVLPSSDTTLPSNRNLIISWWPCHLMKKWINWINTFRCHSMPQHHAYVTVPQHMLFVHYRLLYLSLVLLVASSLNVFLFLCHSHIVLHASIVVKHACQWILLQYFQRHFLHDVYICGSIYKITFLNWGKCRNGLKLLEFHDYHRQLSDCSLAQIADVVTHRLCSIVCAHRMKSYVSNLSETVILQPCNIYL
jgi:hypothetical protein